MASKPARPAKVALLSVAACEALEHAARVHLEKGRYRDAVDGYKALLKTERRPQWLAGLANAYAGRANGLAAKGMLREAVELWRSRFELTGAPLWDGPYVGWLIRAGRISDVLGHLKARRASLGAAPDRKQLDEIATLEAKLAPAVLSASDATLAQLHAESALVQHRPLALAALQAFARKDVMALEQALAGISFRSPYRELRSLLKAMVLWETDQESARAAIARVAHDGPFEQLTAPLRTLLVEGLERLRQWAGLNGSQQTLVLDLLGCPQALAPLLRVMAGADARLAPAALFDLVQGHSRHLPEPVATRAWQWLAPWATRRGCASPRIFGRPSLADQECATALSVEIGGDLDHAETHWVEAAQQLASSGGAHDPLRAALILRHAARSPEHLSRDGFLDQDGAELLTQSLKFDPQDCDTQVQLVAFWRRNGNLKRAREQLDAGLSHFPDDVALLTEAVLTAVAAGAFKKAATTARRLLELDPLNRNARALVGNAHLSHAAKQIAAGKLPAARKEITAAETWFGANVDHGRLLLLQAWTEQPGSPERLRLAQQAATTWGAGLSAGWRLVREAQRTYAGLGVPAWQRLLGEAGLDPAPTLTVAHLLDLVQVLQQEDPVVLKGQDVFAPWRKSIAGMVALPVLDAQTTVRICEAFSRHHAHRLLEAFANAARKRWPEQPIFVYHAVAARFAKLGCIANERDFNDLEDAQERAHQIKDLRLCTRIDTLLEDDLDASEFEPPDFTGLPGSPGFPGLRPDFAKLDPDMFRAMIEQTVKFDGGASFLRQARQDLGDASYRQIEKECAGNRPLLLRRLTELVVAQLSGRMDRPPPIPIPRILKPEPPVAGQGRLFDD